MQEVKRASFFSILQKVGQSLMIPVSVLPAAGLTVALGRMLQNASVGAGGAVTNTFLNAVGKLCYSGGLAVFEQLSLIFAIGVAIGFTGGAAIAGLAAAAGYFTLTNVLKVMTEVRGLDMALNTGVFGGIIVGLLTATLYKKYFQTKLHPIFGFFSGKRLVPIVTVAYAILVGVALGYIWPPIQNYIHAFGVYVVGSSLGPAFYAAGKRLLIPVGLHHVYYPAFLFEFGEFVTAAGQTVKGESARYFAGDTTAGRFMASEFPIMLFGLPAAAFAMYLRAEASKRKAIAGVMLSAALTSIVTGITEPIEFAFIFVAPILYVFHVLMAFLSGFLTSMFDIHLGYTFSASAIDYVLGYFNQKNSSYLFMIVGPVVGLAYFFVFYWAIGFFNLKTPGREEGLTEEVLGSSGASKQKAGSILKALGGSKNLTDLDACITRLRISVKDSSKVNESQLKSLGAAGILNAGQGNFQVIFGVESDLLKDQIQEIIAQGEEESSLLSTSPSLEQKVQPGMLVKQGLYHLKAPISGKVLRLEEVPDNTFAQKLLGDGFAIDPSEGVVYSPVNGTVVQLFRTQHAIGLLSDEGIEVLIHIGIDTVKMNGRGFKAFVTQGQTVKIGDKLLEFDLELVRSEAKSAITPVLITNTSAVKNLKLLKTHQNVKHEDDLFEVSLG